MAPIRTYTFHWPLGDDVRTLDCALGHSKPYSWVLIITSPREDEYEPREWCSMAVRSTEEPNPPPAPSGNPVIALKSYSENAGLVERVEAAGLIKHTGRRLKQGYVELDMVEILVPEEEQIKQCGSCDKWENVGDPERFKRCARCKKMYYCSQACQKNAWKWHKSVCQEGASPNP